MTSQGGYTFVFPGQGAQKSGMGKDVFSAYPESAGRTFREADDILGFSISQLCFEGPAEALAQTQITQPALFTTCVALMRVLDSRSITPFAAAGHSVGEYAALVAAHAITFEDALPVVALRGELMANAASVTPGAMAAIIGLTADQVADACHLADKFGLVEPSNLNAPSQTVISGAEEAVLEAMGHAKDMGGRAIRLKVSAPFHCALMEPVRPKMQEALEKLAIRDPVVPVVANATGDFVVNAEAIRSALLEQLASPVQWTQTVRRLVTSGYNSFLEVGPGKVLSALIGEIDAASTVRRIATAQDIVELAGQ